MKALTLESVGELHLAKVYGATASGFNKSLEMLERNKDELAQPITHEFALDDYAEAFDTVRQRREGVCKALLKPPAEETS